MQQLLLALLQLQELQLSLGALQVQIILIHTVTHSIPPAYRTKRQLLLRAIWVAATLLLAGIPNQTALKTAPKSKHIG